MRKIVSVLICICLVFSLFPANMMTVSAAGGTGTSSNPFLISTKEDLQALSTFASGVDNPNGYTNTSTSYYKLANDIDMTGINWKPVYVGMTNGFKGVFDGDGYVIKNLTINGNFDRGALFGNIDTTSTVKNLGVIDCSIKNTNRDTAAFVGTCYGTIENCFSTGTIQGVDVVGGIAGWISNNSKVKNCYSTANVTGSGACIGGIVGIHEDAKEISNCYFTGNVQGTLKAGGIIGNSNDSANPTVFAGNASLGQQVVATTNTSFIYRLYGRGGSGFSGANYAWEGMKLYQNTSTQITIPQKAANNATGADFAYINGTLNHQFSDVFASDANWTYTTNGLPILSAFVGKSTYTQSSTLPSWITNRTVTKKATPTASFEASTMALSNVNNTMKYSVDGGSTWVAISASTADLSSATVTTANGIKVKDIGGDIAAADVSAITGTDSDVQTITITKASTPTTAVGGAGTITGVNSTMQYKKSADSTWGDITGTSVTGLTEGSYDVRVKANGTALASDVQTVSVGRLAAGTQADPFLISTKEDLQALSTFFTCNSNHTC